MIYVITLMFMAIIAVASVFFIFSDEKIKRSQDLS